MCGIVGYVGSSPCVPFLRNGLRRLEYRGYDSSGICVHEGESLRFFKAVGPIASLESVLPSEDLKAHVGIGHTRWATHGKPSVANAHPHRDCSSKIAVVHNGIIENYSDLKKELEADHHVFVSETDTEVLAHLIEFFQKNGDSFVDAVHHALTRIRGTYGIAVMSVNDPGILVVARMGSPIVIGFGTDGVMIASDVSALIGQTRQMLFLDDGELAVCKADGSYEIRTMNKELVQKEIHELDASLEEVQKGGFEHFMLKEMLEQPQTVENTIRGRIRFDEGTVVLGGLRDAEDRLAKADRIVIVACGSAYYAGMFGRSVLEQYAGIPVEVELASEFRYRRPVISSSTVVIAVSQSGETADTLAAVREARRLGALTVGIVNVVGSTIARETDVGVYNHAGPEISVASTKAFMSQCVVFLLLSVFLGRQRHLSSEDAGAVLRALCGLPEEIVRVIACLDGIKSIAKKCTDTSSAFYLGRCSALPLAYEGALKLKEVSYIHAEGYATGEMKHGPIALEDADFLNVVLCFSDHVHEKTLSNIEEIRARAGRIVVIAEEGDDSVQKLTEDVFYIPRVHESIRPLLALLPLQVFAYEVAVAKGMNPDRPRNLAKSVTVE